MIRKYSELIRIPTFEDRFRYLALHGSVGIETFGFDRYFNQRFYRSKEWKMVRDYVISRDLGCDLAMEDREIFDKAIIHHMNPITMLDIRESSDYLLNPEYLITTTKLTHDAIHYGDESILRSVYPVERRVNDTRLW